jgi:hypothetical protein
MRIEGKSRRKIRRQSVADSLLAEFRIAYNRVMEAEDDNLQNAEEDCRP